MRLRADAGSAVREEKPVYLRIRFTRSFLTHLLKALRAPRGRHMVARLRRFVRPGSTIVDVGANTGHFSRRLALSAPNVTVVAFEPQSYARLIMRLSGMIRPMGNVLILPFALGTEPGLAQLNLPVKRGHSFGTGLAHLGASSRLAERFPLVWELASVQTLDAVLARLDLPPVSLMKIDVEGFELSVLKGARKTIERDRPVILAEVAHVESFGHTLAEVAAFFRYRGYLIFDPSTYHELDGIPAGLLDGLFVPQERRGELGDTA